VGHDLAAQSLIAEYLRGVEGSHDVLRDAFLERGHEPLPLEGELEQRFETAFARLAKIDQVRVASASVRRLAGAIDDRTTHRQVVEALDAAEAEAAPELVRTMLFRSWQASPAGDGKRVVWAAWMLLRDQCETTLRTTRAVRAGEAELQIEAVAAALAW